MHPVEHIIFMGGVLLFCVVPANPVHILFCTQYFALTAATTHAGFEALVLGPTNRLNLGTFHHQMHHKYFECNYGGLELPWDLWFGSFHDGTNASDIKQKERRQRIMRESRGMFA